MLGKLLKYEWKSTRRIFPLIYVAVLVIALISGLTMRGGSLSSDTPVGMLIFLMIYVILIAALLIVTVVVIIGRFYKNMLSQEGYLTHVLPVKAWQHIASKTIMSLIWIALAIAVIIVSMFLLTAATGELSMIMAQIDLNEIFGFLGDYKPMAALFIVCLIVQLIRLILQFYTAMAIGGTANKHKIFFSFLAFVVIAIVVSILNTVLSLGTVTSVFDTVFMSDVPQIDLTMVYVKQLISDAVISAVFFLITEYFLRKRLNLE